jgi:hypothetical protein
MNYPDPNQVEQADWEQLNDWARHLPSSENDAERAILRRILARLSSYAR